MCLEKRRGDVGEMCVFSVSVGYALGGWSEGVVVEYVVLGNFGGCRR